MGNEEVKEKQWVRLGIGIFLIFTVLAFPFKPGLALAQSKEVKIDILSSKLGGPSYVLSFALADIINKTHPWLRATAIETNGATWNLRLLIEEPKRKKNTIFFSTNFVNHTAEVPLKPFTERYTDMRGIASYQGFVWLLCTLDPNFKVPDSFIGKRIALHIKGGSFAQVVPALLKEGWGIPLEKVKIQYPGMGGGLEALGDGMVDVAIAGSSTAPLWSPMPALGKLMSTKKVYFIDQGRDAIKKAEKACGYPVGRGITRVPPGTFGPTQPTEMNCITESLGWFADKHMPDDLVYEITKTIYENADKFGSYHAAGKGVTKGNVAALSYPEEMFHPGAVRFYKEHHVKIGME